MLCRLFELAKLGFAFGLFGWLVLPVLYGKGDWVALSAGALTIGFLDVGGTTSGALVRLERRLLVQGRAVVKAATRRRQ